jgi:thioesterase domain-containing protein/aryl carrier-like protein
VLLDNQLLPLGDDIAVSWDFAESHFDVAVIEELFGHYVLTLLGCADGDGTVPPVPARSAAAIKRAMLSRTPGGANGGPGGAAPGRASGIGQAEPAAAAPPAAAEEAALLAVAREHAGLSGLGLADNLFAAGLDSLSFIALVAKVETLAQTRIPLASALADPTVERLAGLVAQAGAKPLDAGRLAAGRSAAERSGGETLVWMRPALDAGDGAGGGVKALLAHGGFGNVEVYADLAVELPEDWEVWGVSFEPAARPYPQAMTIEEVCAPYLAEIRRRFQAGDRLVIVGWSVGGTIAAELAGRLGGDFDVEVILLDSLAPGPIVEVGDFTLDGERRLLESCAAAGRTGGGEPATAAELWTLVESSMADRAEESRLVEALATAISPTLVEDLGAARGNVTIRQFNALRTLIGARNAYFPALTVSRVLAVHASDGESWNNDAWTCLSPAGLEERELDGNHYSILMRPSARITARVIADHARRRSSRTGRA